MDILTWHEINSHTNLFLAAVLFVGTILMWRPVRGPAWPMTVATVLVLTVQSQAGFGYSRDLALRIPLGTSGCGATSARTTGQVLRTGPFHD